MKIQINKETQAYKESKLYLQEIIDRQEIKSKMQVCKVNGVVVRKQERKDFVIQEGDVVVIIPIVSGG